MFHASTPIGQQWLELPPLDATRHVLGPKLGIVPGGPYPNGERYFVFAAGRLLALLLRQEPPPPAPPLGASDVATLGSDPFITGHVERWDALARALLADPDFRSYVRRSVSNYLRPGDEIGVEDVASAFVHEAHAHAVEHAAQYHSLHPTFHGRWAVSWVHQVERDLGRQPVQETLNELRGDRPSTGRNRGRDAVGNAIYQQSYLGTPVSQITNDPDEQGAVLDKDDTRSPAPDLEAAIDTLPDDEREVFRRWMQGDTFAEIGRTLGRSADRANMTYRRACDL